MENVIVLFGLLGLILIILGFWLQRNARKTDEEICKNKDPSDDEFHLIREKKVWKPSRNGNYLFIIGFLLMIPNSISLIRRGIVEETYIPIIIGLMTTIAMTIALVITIITLCKES